MEAQEKTQFALTRKELAEAIYKQIPHLSRNKTAELVEQVLEEITLAIVGNEKVKLRGFGNFKIQHKRARIGRNPKTLEEAVITARRVVKFVPSPQLIAKVNGETVDDTFNDEEDWAFSRF